eukprot:jgi/Psemu1/21442/gm1.21442_g
MTIFKSIRRIGRNHKDKDKEDITDKKTKDSILLNYSMVSNGYSTSSISTGSSNGRRATSPKKTNANSNTNSNSNSNTNKNKNSNTNTNTKKNGAVLVEASLPLFHPSMRTSSLWTYDEKAVAKDRCDLEADLQPSPHQWQPSQLQLPFVVNEDEWDCASAVSVISNRTFSSHCSNNVHHPFDQPESQHEAEGPQHHHIQDNVIVTVVSPMTSGDNEELESSHISSTPFNSSNVTATYSHNTKYSSKDGTKTNREDEDVKLEVIVTNDTSLSKVRHMDRIVRILKRLDQKKPQASDASDAAATISIVKTTTNNTDPHRVSHIFEDEASIGESSMGSSNILSENDFRMLQTNAVATKSLLMRSPTSSMRQPRYVNTTTTTAPKPNDNNNNNNNNNANDTASYYSPTSVTFQAMFDSEATPEALGHPCASPEATVVPASATEPSNRASTEQNKPEPTVGHSFCEAVSISPNNEQGGAVTMEDDGDEGGCRSCLSSPRTMSQDFQDALREIQQEFKTLYSNSPLATGATATKTPTAAGSNGATDESEYAAFDQVAAETDPSMTRPIKLSKHPITSILNGNGGRNSKEWSLCESIVLSAAGTFTASDRRVTDKNKFYLPRTPTQASI